MGVKLFSSFPREIAKHNSNNLVKSTTKTTHVLIIRKPRKPLMSDSRSDAIKPPDFKNGGMLLRIPTR